MQSCHPGCTHGALWTMACCWLREEQSAVTATMLSSVWEYFSRIPTRRRWDAVGSPAGEGQFEAALRALQYWRYPVTVRRLGLASASSTVYRWVLPDGPLLCSWLCMYASVVLRACSARCSRSLCMPERACRSVCVPGVALRHMVRLSGQCALRFCRNSLWSGRSFWSGGALHVSLHGSPVMR